MSMIITAKDNDKIKYTKSLLKSKNRKILFLTLQLINPYHHLLYIWVYFFTFIQKIPINDL